MRDASELEGGELDMAGVGGREGKIYFSSPFRLQAATSLQT
jgi:hypothetical protein